MLEISRPVITLAEKDLHRLGGSHYAREASREGDRGGEVRVVPLFLQVALHHPTTDAGELECAVCGLHLDGAKNRLANLRLH